jgi:topoisomerase-4 subunit A
MVSRNKSGKAVLRARDAGVLSPQLVYDYEDDWLAAVTSAGRLLVFALADLPVMAKGKGVKIINVPIARYKSGEERLVAVAVFREGDRLRLYSGKQHMKLKPADIDLYLGTRAQRGGNLPRGYRQPTALEIDRGDV